MNDICSIEGCSNDHYSRGWCRSHYDKNRRRQILPGGQFRLDPNRSNAERIYSRLIENSATGCWEWSGSKDGKGYGQIRIAGRLVPVHRWVYEDMVTDIPAGLVIDHLCRNRLCANPGHLEPITHQENISRGDAPSAIVARTRKALVS